MMSFEELYNIKNHLVMVDQIFNLNSQNFIVRGWFHPNAYIDTQLGFRFDQNNHFYFPIKIVRYPRRDIQDVLDTQAEPLGFIMALQCFDQGRHLSLDWLIDEQKIELKTWLFPEEMAPLSQLQALAEIEKKPFTEALMKLSLDSLIDHSALSWLFDKMPKKSAILPKDCQQAFNQLANPNLQPNIEEHSVKLIAYYLPQFHPILENDEWWGTGFTEWTNVTQAIPYFKDHYQPHIPSELGYYDLRLPEIRAAQAKLAREYGIYGFCYYYYWFSGRHLLERPLQEVFESGQPDFPFCICWANENWSRRWDGSEQDILVSQVHNSQTDEAFIYDVIPLFKDPRYIKIQGAPLLIIYRISLMPNPKQTAQLWRDICAAHGIDNIHLCMAESFGLSEPRQYGFDSAVQFPPHGMVANLENDFIEDLAEGYTGNIYDIRKVIQYELGREAPVYKRFPGVMTAWDNTARKKKAGNVFINSNPEAYELWLRAAIDQAKQRLPKEEQFVFINAWNEWAEGTHLEPDKKYGRAYLEATKRALIGQSDWSLLLDYAEQQPILADEIKQNFLTDIRFALERLTQVNQHLLSIMGNHGMPKFWSKMKKGLPNGWLDLKWIEAGQSNVEFLNHYSKVYNQRIPIEASQKLWLCGWIYYEEQQPPKRETPTYLILEDIYSQVTYFALILQRYERQDLVDSFRSKNALFSGLRSLFDISHVANGCYRMGMACIDIAYRQDKRVLMIPLKVEIEIG
ncbi:MAG: hypothetical protein RL637_1726 [Pseudomonadota bacterium]